VEVKEGLGEEAEGKGGEEKRQGRRREGE